MANLLLREEYVLDLGARFPRACEERFDHYVGVALAGSRAAVERGDFHRSISFP